MIDETLVAFFGSTLYAAKSIAAKVGKRVHSGKVPRNQANRYPRLFLQRTAKDSLCDLDGGGRGTLITDTFDFEIISNASSDVLAISDLMWRDIHCAFGSIASTQTVKGIMIDSQDDDYEPKGVGADYGLDVASFSMQVMYAST